MFDTKICSIKLEAYRSMKLVCIAGFTFEAVLYTGATRADFQSSGTMPECRELLNNFVRMGAIS